MHVTVTPGNPLLPPGARARGYMSGMASILLQEERQLLGLGAGGGAPGGKAPSPQFTTTFEAEVARPEGDKQQGQPVVLPEGYTVNNVLASSCLLYLPSEPGLVGHLVRRVACVDTGALAAGMAQQLGLTMGSGLALGLGVPAKLQAALASAAGSRAGSRRQSIQDVATWGAGAHGGSGVLMQQPPGSPRAVQQQGGGGSNGAGSYYGYGAVPGGSHNSSSCLPPGGVVRRSLNAGGTVAADSVVSLSGQQPDAAHYHAHSHLAPHQPYPPQQQPYSSGPSPPGSYPGYGPPDASVALRSRPPSRNSLRPSVDIPPPLAPARSPSPAPEPHAAPAPMPAPQLLTFQPQPHAKPHALSNLSRSGSACSISPASVSSQPASASAPAPTAASTGFLTAALGPHQPPATHSDPSGQPGGDDSLGLETTASLATWAVPGSGLSAETLAHLLERRESQRHSSGSNRRSGVLSSSHGQGLLGGSGSGSMGAQDDSLGRPKSSLHHAASTGSMPWPSAGLEQQHQHQQGAPVDSGAGEALHTVFAPPMGPPTVGAALAGPWDGPPQGLGMGPAAGGGVAAAGFPWDNGARHSRRYSHDALMGLVAGNGNASVPGHQQPQQLQQQLPDHPHLAANGYHAAHQHPFTPQRQLPFYSHGHHNSATGMAQPADYARTEAGAGMAWGWPGPNAAALQYSVPTFSAMAAAAAAAGAGGVVCCSPGACEALVAMGLGNRLGGVSNDCDYPPDVCTSRRVVLGWAAPEEGQGRGMVRGGIRALAPSASAQAVGAAAVAGFLSVVGRLGGGKAAAGGAAARQSGDRERGGRGGAGGGAGAEDGGTEGGGTGGRVLLLDELALRQEPPSLLVLPDVAELSMGERAQLEQVGRGLRVGGWGSQRGLYARERSEPVRSLPCHEGTCALADLEDIPACVLFLFIARPLASCLLMRTMLYHPFPIVRRWCSAGW